MAWATVDDLLVGDISVDNIDVDAYLTAAEDEINVHAGRYYVLPLPTLTGHLLTLFKLIQSRLASGRLLMAQAAGDEDVLAYGKSLVDFAYEQLYTIGVSIAVTGATSVSASSGSRAPSVVDPNVGQDSPWKVYEQYVHEFRPYGPVPTIDWTAT